MKTTINDMNIAYDDHGMGLPVLFLHAFPLNRNMWEGELTTLLSEERYRLVALDWPGFGESDIVADVSTMELFADCVAGLMDTLGMQSAVLCGLSMGGYGTWHLAGKYPGRFAAIVPICGGILMPQISRQQSPDDTKPYTDAADKIGNKTPVWIFHGSADEAVPVAESQRMAAAMKALGGEVHYTEVPGVGHNSWDKAYTETEMLTWLFSKSLGRAGSK